jgi:hypothetical protein
MFFLHDNSIAILAIEFVFCLARVLRVVDIATPLSSWQLISLLRYFRTDKLISEFQLFTEPEPRLDVVIARV